jgi:hypothetical protein
VSDATFPGALDDSYDDWDAARVWESLQPDLMSQQTKTRDTVNIESGCGILPRADDASLVSLVSPIIDTAIVHSSAAEGLPPARAVDSLASEVIIELEKRIAKAIRSITQYKELSGEPWSAVLDLSSFQCSSRHFSTVARHLAQWDINKLGQALNCRDLISTGRSMRPDQHDLVKELFDALDGSDISEETLQHATYFFLEVGSFD